MFQDLCPLFHITKSSKVIGGLSISELNGIFIFLFPLTVGPTHQSLLDLLILHPLAAFLAFSTFIRTSHSSNCNPNSIFKTTRICVLYLYVCVWTHTPLISKDINIPELFPLTLLSRESHSGCQSWEQTPSPTKLRCLPILASHDD